LIKKYGLLVIERAGTDLSQVFESEFMAPYAVGFSHSKKEEKPTTDNKHRNRMTFIVFHNPFKMT